MKTVTNLILTLSIIGIVAGGCLSLVSDWATPLIAANQKAETEKAIYLVQPEGKNYEEMKNAGFAVYKVLNAASSLIGYSIVYEGNGFQGKIRIMVGLKEDLNTITSIEILEQTETPGLGTKVTEDPYKSQYKNLNAVPNVEWVKGVPPSKPNEIQAITGATISSKSVVEIVNNGIAQMRKLKEGGKL